MKWRALATDFDGTIATDGVVDEPTRLALVRLRSANLRTFLVTGRELSDFQGMKGFLPIFDMIVAENGAVLYEPGSDTTRSLGAPPPESFIAELSRRGVTPGVGISIVATREPFQAIVLEVIKELGLELQVIFNKGAVMVLPSGINKATGLQAALEAFGLSSAEVIVIGSSSTARHEMRERRLCGKRAFGHRTLKSASEMVRAVRGAVCGRVPISTPVPRCRRGESIETSSVSRTPIRRPYAEIGGIPDVRVVIWAEK